MGLPGTFTITPPGTGQHPEEVVAYAYTLDSGEYQAAPTVPVAANYGATITVAPLRDGLNKLYVWSKDRAGPFSAQPVEYSFSVNPAPAQLLSGYLRRRPVPPQPTSAGTTTR